MFAGHIGCGPHRYWVRKALWMLTLGFLFPARASLLHPPSPAALGAEMEKWAVFTAKARRIASMLGVVEGSMMEVRCRDVTCGAVRCGAVRCGAVGQGAGDRYCPRGSPRFAWQSHGEAAGCGIFQQWRKGCLGRLLSYPTRTPGRGQHVVRQPH
jgi:hypothetical protein